MDSVFFDYPIDGAMDSQGHLVALFQTDASIMPWPAGSHHFEVSRFGIQALVGLS